MPQSGLVRSRRGPVVRGHDRRRGFSSALRIERGVHLFKKGTLRCRFRRRAGERDSVTPRITPAIEILKVRSHSKRPSSHLLSPRSEPTSRDRATRTDARGRVRRPPFCSVPFFPGGASFQDPPRTRTRSRATRRAARIFPSATRARVKMRRAPPGSHLHAENTHASPPLRDPPTLFFSSLHDVQDPVLNLSKLGSH